MPHSKLPEQRLDEIREELGRLQSELPQTANADADPSKELATARNAIARVRTDITQWREFVDDSEVLDE